MEKKSKFTLRGLTERQSDFLELYSETFNLSSKNQAILALINEKMASDIAVKKTEEITNDSQIKQKIGKKRIQISLRENDYLKLEEICENSDTSPNYYIIRLILNSINSDISRLMGNEIEQLKKSNYELHKVGVNINQIAKAINSGNNLNLNLDLIQCEINQHIEVVKNILNSSLNKY